MSILEILGVISIGVIILAVVCVAVSFIVEWLFVREAKR